MTPDVQGKVNYLIAATEPQLAVRRLAGLTTGAVAREQARLSEAQYLVTNLVPLLNTQIAATNNPTTVNALQANIAGLNAGVTVATAAVAAANAAITAEQTNQTALSAQLSALEAAG